jgi:hypothetical protein
MLLRCDWDDLQIEPPAAEVPCPVCHAPTDATVMLGQIAGLGSTGNNPHAAALWRLGRLNRRRARVRRLIPEWAGRQSSARPRALTQKMPTRTSSRR